MVRENLRDPEGNTKMTIIARRTVGLGRIGKNTPNLISRLHRIRCDPRTPGPCGSGRVEESLGLVSPGNLLRP